MYRARSRQKGFVIAPILYLLGLIGVTAGVLFSGYSQIIKNNILLTNAQNDRNSLQTAANYLSGAAVLGTDGITVCPPRSTNASAVCTGSPQYLTDLASLSASDPHLPTGWQNAASTGSPYEVGILSGGLSQLDSEGHYWIVCRWENTTSETTQPSIKIIGVGASGALNTKCGDTLGSGGNYLKQLYVADLMQRASAWNLTGNTATFGATGSKVTVDASGDITTAGNIIGGAGVFSSLVDSGTATISGAATMNGGASVTGGLESDTIRNSGNVTIGGFVGIGTASPTFSLDVMGNIEIKAPDGGIHMVSSTNGYAADIYQAPSGLYIVENSVAPFYITTNNAEPIIFTTNSAEAVRITSAGTIGIGTTIPGATLDINGSALIEGGNSLTFNPPSGNVSSINAPTSGRLKFTVDGTDAFEARLQGIMLPVGQSLIDQNANTLLSFGYTGSAVNYLTITNAITGASPVLSANGANANIGITLTPKGTGNILITNGNVGIGTTSPTYTLQVGGTFAASGAANVGSLSVAGTTTLGAALTGTSAMFSGSVTASQFIGAIALGTGGATLSGILPITNGGTGASTALAALLNLGVTNASGYLAPPLPLTGVASGVCAVPTVGTDGRVTACGTSGSFSSLMDSGAATISGNLSVAGTTGLAGLTAATGSFSGNLAASSFSLVGDESMYGNLGVGCAANDNLSLTVCHSSENGPIAFFTQSTNTDGVVGINAPTGYGAYIAFDDNETDYWSVGKAEAQYGRGFYVWDYTNKVDMIYGEYPSGDLLLGESTSLYLTITATGKAGFGVYPINLFDIAGGVAIGTAYAGASIAPTNGLIVQGNVGIGTASPAVTLDVAGYMRLKKESAAPATCSSTIDGAIALTAVYTICVCKSGTGWVTASTGSTACTW